MKKTTTAHAHIVRTAGACGGSPRVAGHRIRVSDVVVWHDHLGHAPEEITRRHGLTLGEVHSALAYYCDHVQEIQRELKAAERLERRLRRNHVSLLKGRRSG